jgi:hypothetical protein
MIPAKPSALAAVLCGISTLGGGLANVQTAAGDDFRVENKIFRGKHRTPTSESTTIFQGGVVYDYLKEPPEVIVLDKAADRFVLLDTVRRVRAELATKDVADFADQLHQLAANQDDPFKKFLAAPKFTTRFDKAANQLILSSPWMTYRLLLDSPAPPEIAAQYRQFCDWYARLNTVLNPGSKPPFARLLVNAALAEREATAREVHLTMTLRKTFPPKRVTVRSEHQLIPQVAGADLDRVAQTRQFMDIFKLVSFEQYRKSYGQ